MKSKLHFKRKGLGVHLGDAEFFHCYFLQYRLLLFSNFLGLFDPYLRLAVDDAGLYSFSWFSFFHLFFSTFFVKCWRIRGNPSYNGHLSHSRDALMTFQALFTLPSYLFLEPGNDLCVVCSTIGRFASKILFFCLGSEISSLFGKWWFNWISNCAAYLVYLV